MVSRVQTTGATLRSSLVGLLGAQPASGRPHPGRTRVRSASAAERPVEVTAARDSRYHKTCFSFILHGGIGGVTRPGLGHDLLGINRCWARVQDVDEEGLKHLRLPLNSHFEVGPQDLKSRAAQLLSAGRKHVRGERSVVRTRSARGSHSSW